MTIPATVMAVLLFFVFLTVVPALAADQSKLKAATQQVESGARAIGSGVESMARGVGNTFVEGAKVAGEKVKESSKAAEPGARSAWDHARTGVSDFGQSVKGFLSGLFSK